MEPLKYRRDLPNGSKQYFESRIEPPTSEEPYYDDVLGKQSYPTENNGSGGLELLFFGKEQSYPDRTVHHHQRNGEYLLHYVTDGCGTFDGRTVGAGEGFLAFPGQTHLMSADREHPWHFMWIAFRGNGAAAQMKQIGLDKEHPFFFFSFGDRLDALFDDILYRDHGDYDLNTYMLGVFYMLLSYHKKEYLRRTEQKPLPNPYVQKAVAYMDEHYREPIRIDDVAASIPISRKYLCTVMERQLGLSPKEYLLQRRIEAAAELLLRSDRSVGEVAAEVGYPDYTQFSRLFRQKTGMSPRDFLKQNAHLRTYPSHERNILQQENHHVKQP